jgi:hypothetical protein
VSEMLTVAAIAVALAGAFRALLWRAFTSRIEILFYADMVFALITNRCCGCSLPRPAAASSRSNGSPPGEATLLVREPHGFVNALLVRVFAFPLKAAAHKRRSACKRPRFRIRGVLWCGTGRAARANLW